MLLNLNCELTNPENMLQVIDAEFPSGAVSYNIYSVCRWPEREKIEKKKQRDLELYDELKPAEHYGDYL